MPVILLTGGAGYVGSVCAAELLRQHHEVVIVDDLSTGHRQAIPAGAAFYQIDVGDAAALSAVFQRHAIDAVFHFAAKALIPESVTDPAIFYRVNVSAGLVLLDMMREFGVKNFVFSSSAAVYGNGTEVPIREDQPKAPVNSYGETKLAFERALEWYARAYGFSAFAFRYFNASGAIANLGERHEPETHIIPLIYEAACGEREHFTIFGDDYDTPDGTCIRDYVHVLDIAEAHILALQQMAPSTFRAFNIGTGISYSVRQICGLASKVVGHEIPVKVGMRRNGDPAVLCAAPHRLMTELGWQPKHSDMMHILTSAWQWKRLSRKVAAGRP
jgi:UDP-glucose 4-epimerase